ncbi:MAG: NupC/NupG family nucleoside CNT transporter [Elusimicrobia bacterium CG06_land_8_20_14_3_00_38_11]|nr:MAG: NupC/NupG family nucleoside CNT transporter [Elusimicrobia bacterium CG06_land_8_20_14_3_00_38_11]
MERWISVLGTVVLVGIAWLFSMNRKKINWKTVGVGIALQVILALIVLVSPPGRWFFSKMNDVIVRMLSFSEDGARFLFGNLVANYIPVGVLENHNFVETIRTVAYGGAFFAFSVLPTIIFFSSLMSVMYYLGVMQLIVLAFAKVMTKFMGVSGAESLSCSANIFVGQTEAPLLVRPFISDMTKSELLAVMTGGMATVAGGVMAAYVGMLKDYFPSIAGHLLTASVMSAPAALVMAKIILPETGESKTAGVVKIHYEKTDANIIDAAANGATVGLQLALNVAGCLIAFMSLLAMLNFLIGWTGGLVGFAGLSLQKIFGFIFAPLAWIMGVPWKDCFIIGNLMGVKTAVNEFVAYFDFAVFIKQNPGVLAERSMIIATYALCGFSNFLSIAIQIGGIGALAPNRRHDLAKLGLWAVLAGSLACFMSATIAGILIK